MHGFTGMGWGMGWGWILLIIIVAATIWLTNMSAKAKQRKSQNTVLDILKERYARGEINKEEYDRLKQELL